MINVCVCGHAESHHYNTAGRCSGGARGARCGCALWEPRGVSLDAAVPDDPGTILVCTRIVDGPMVPGVTERCATCHEVVTISPATYEVWKNAPEPRSVLCNACWIGRVVKDKKPIEIMHPTAGQLAEVREALSRERPTQDNGNG